MQILKMSRILLCFVLFVFSCSYKERDANNTDNSEAVERLKVFLAPFRQGKMPSLSTEDQLAKDLYNAGGIEEYKKNLAAGANPNYCFGENGWIDSNPLDNLAMNHYDTYLLRELGDPIIEPPPYFEILSILVEAGADINRRPYVWHRVFMKNKKNIDHIIRQRKASTLLSADPKIVGEHIQQYVADVNRLLEAFIRAGADPDKKGHPYPYDWEKTKGKMTDEEANRYFEQGTRPINEAIQKGIVWESQVDLLLKYTKLDEESLKAAERSGDPKMIEKIKKLWEEQQASTQGTSSEKKSEDTKPNKKKGSGTSR